MYLKSIEVHGFKSFANRIVFQFHNGITGIVGPNGSGKSNVADAVRWVLGEQRIKQLRGSSMQDVIFSGTETRKPLSYAYVAITLDNSDRQLAIDYDEVTIARRIYRSGESEYLINGNVCRLRDVNELFYDTGIGKEGYSIIGQGQIDKILSGKPEDRRELFDEAAGIVKFKRRKLAAQNKLENEKQNLLRVNDILTELERQAGPLERQAETAKIYLKKKEALKALDVNMFLLEHNRLVEQQKALEEKYALACGDLEQITKEYGDIKTEYERIQNTIEELDRTIEQMRDSVSTNSLLKGRLEGQIEVFKEQMKSAAGNAEHLRERGKALLAEIAEKEQEKADILSQKADIDTQVSELKENRDRAQEALTACQRRIDELNTLVETAKNAIIEELNLRATVKSKAGRLDTMMEQANIRRAEINSRLLRAKSDEAARDEIIRKLEAEFERVTKELADLNAAEKEIDKKLLSIREELIGKDAYLRETQNKYHQEQSKRDVLLNLAERYEGYGGSVKKVMEQKDRVKGIIGVVADIIKTDERYETAIETALGGSIQNIVTDTEDTAKRMIRFLKENKLGRATFLPLNSLEKVKELQEKEALKEPGVIGAADTLVRTKEQYKNVAKALLCRILVVDNVDHAVKIARKYDYGIRMVTLEGELLVPGGAISGGAFKNNSNLLGRRREIEEMEKQIAAYARAVKDTEQEIEDKKALRNKLRLDLEEHKAQIQRKSIEQNTARLNAVQARERMAEEEEGFQNLSQELTEVERVIAQTVEQKEQIASELTASETLEQERQVHIAAWQLDLEEERVKENEALELTRKWELKVQKRLQTQGFQQSNVDRIQGELDRLVAEEQEVREALAEAEAQILQKEHDIEETRLTIEASKEAQSASEKKIREDMALREELYEKQKNFFQIREDLAEKQTALDKEVYRLGAQKEKIEESIEAQINYMWDEYEITLSDAASVRDESMTDLAAMKKEVASLKEQIKKLGDVNVNAIEDYKNLMERYSFLKTQHNDLVEAQKTLEGIIAELDSAMRKQFSEKFADINREFDKVFKELFGGGKGTLELMEDEDILEAGVRIIAQPPGKKLQNMMQLSGGEKALTAISLLFAIQNLKPSPFCLLDEIEAALDESNVGRFAKYLHKLTKNTQFIVITHRRGTMEQVDRLYGITMQEKGVSALVSVNLIDKDLDD